MATRIISPAAQLPEKIPYETVAVAVAWARPKMHRAAKGTTCSCGHCQHTILLASRKFDVPGTVVRELVGLSNGEPPPPKPPRPQPPLMGQVGANATIVVDGQRVSAAQGLLALADTARHESGGE